MKAKSAIKYSLAPYFGAVLARSRFSNAYFRFKKKEEVAKPRLFIEGFLCFIIGNPCFGNPAIFWSY